MDQTVRIKTQDETGEQKQFFLKDSPLTRPRVVVNSLGVEAFTDRYSFQRTWWVAGATEKSNCKVNSRGCVRCDL